MIEFKYNWGDTMKEIMDQNAIRRSLVRIAHEIVEKNKGCNNLVLVGIKTRGSFLAKRMVHIIHDFEGEEIPYCEIDIRYWRDDVSAEDKKELPLLDVDFKDKVVVLVDDVLFRGRTVRAAMDAVMYYGRAKEIHLAVLIDRGHRALPIRADYVGKNVPTSIKEDVKVKVFELDREDGVIITTN